MAFLLWSSAVRVHDSQACRKMDVTRERISRILELKEIFLSFQTGYNLVNAAVVCATLERISGLEPSSVITEPRYLILVTVSSLCPFTLISYKDHVTNEEVRAKIQQANGPHEDLLTIVRDENCSGMVMSPVHQVWPKPSCKAQ